MKLKKVVSLALAGVMAVSMLAGCGTNKKDEPTQDENGATQVGYSAEFAKIADLDLDYVAFKDSTADQAALQKAVASCTDAQLLAALVGGNLGINPDETILNGAMWVFDVPDTLELRCVDVFTSEADLNSYAVSSNDLMESFGWYFANTDTGNANKEMNQTLKAGAIAAVDGTMDTESVLAQVNKLMRNALSRLPETGVGGSNGGTKYDYSYTVSVSLVNRVATSTDLVKADMDFVAVTVTRTGTPHQA